MPIYVYGEQVTDSQGSASVATRTQVAVVGVTGYAGGELARLLHDHPSLELAVAATSSRGGAALNSVHPHLVESGVVLVDSDPAVLAEVPLVFTALPHGHSAALVAALPADTCVVDLGADFRLDSSEQWNRYYAGGHAGSWLYGLPELPGRAEQIAQATRVANPGCYATAITLALAPLLADGLVEPEDVVVVAASGTSGAGRQAAEHLIASEVMGSMSAYKVGGTHQHTPEVEQTLSDVAGAPVRMSFTPTLAPMSRGILATCTARMAPGVGVDALRATIDEQYAYSPFVHLLPDGEWPRTGATVGSNAAHLQVAADEHSGRAVVVCALDNLVKGAAGQAIQNANLMLGLPMKAGLSALGVAP